MKTGVLMAGLVTELGDGAPEWICYAPKGTHEIQASLDGKAARVRVTVDEATAEALQADLARRIEEGGPQPFFDLHHEARAAACYPVEFAWRTFRVNGKEVQGVGARVQWTPVGLEAIKADKAAGVLPAVAWFSPRCAFGGGKILGLLPASAGNAAGGLVSDPAFTAGVPLVAGKQETKGDVMNEKVKIALAEALGMAPEDFDGEDAVEKLMAGLKGYGEKLVKPMEAAKKLLADEVEKLKGAAADAWVDSLGLPVTALEARKFLRGAWMTDPQVAEKAGKELCAARKVPGEGRLTDEGGGEKEEPLNESAIVVEAKALQAGKPGMTWSEAHAATLAKHRAGKA